MSLDSQEKPFRERIPETIVERWLTFDPRRQTFSATIGTSIETLQRFLETGSLPSYPKEKQVLPYHSQLSKFGKHLYYVNYVFGELENNRPELALEIMKEMPDWDRTSCLENFSPYHARHNAQFYAFMQAVRDRFRDLSGFSEARFTYNDALFLANYLNPEYFNDVLKILWNSETINEDLSEIKRNAHPGTIKKILGLIDRPTLQNLVSQSLERRGVIIYFDSRIFTKAHPGIESESELMVVRNEPISKQDVIGLEILKK